MSVRFNFRIETVPLKEIVFAEYNPETRTSNVSKLADSIKEEGQLRPVSLVLFPDGSKHTADGHRTITSLKQLGEKEVKAVIYRPDENTVEAAKALLDKLFVELNKSTKAFNGRDRLNAGLRGGPVFDPNTKAAIALIDLLFPDPAEREMMIKAEVTTTILNLAKKSTRYVLNGDISETSQTFVNRLRNHIFYLLRNNVQQPVIAYMRLGFDAKALRDAIDNNRPPPRVSSPKLRETWVGLNGKTKKVRRSPGAPVDGAVVTH